jgi:hypothetical protein
VSIGVGIQRFWSMKILFLVDPTKAIFERLTRKEQAETLDTDLFHAFSDLTISISTQSAFSK